MMTMKKVCLGAIAAGIMSVGALAGSTPADAGEKYNATFYVAGMGGHFAKAEATIDPSAATPISVKSLTKVDIGTRATHPVHDPRIDAKDRNTMYWSTYKIDAEIPNVQVTHVGKTDLKTDQVITDQLVSLPPEATKIGSLYCGSGQSENSYLPISMANLGFIDVFNKADLKKTQRVFLEGTAADIGKPYKFYHGVNSPDMKKMLITINEADTPQGNTVGKVHFVELDMAELENGKVKVLQKGLATGKEKETVSFRMYYSNDGKQIAASGADRMYLLDSKLQVIDSEMMGDYGQNHDAMFTPDDKYVVVTTRKKEKVDGEMVMDGKLALYDVAQKKMIGNTTSVCQACHNDAGIGEHAVLCGLDANYK